MMGHFEREVYKGSQVGLAELEEFGWTATSRATDLALVSHAHQGAYEICLIIGGAMQWWVGHEIYQLGRGSVYVTQPDELHGGIDEVMHPGSLYWLLFPLSGGRPLAGLTAAQTQALMQGLAGLKRRTFKSSPQLEASFKQLHEELRDEPAMAPLAARAALHRLLVQLLRDHDAALEGPETHWRSDTMRQAMRWIDQHMTEDVAVEDMAKAVGLSVSRFHERFLGEVGLTPADYRTHLRIRRAQYQLRATEQTMTRIGFDVGFSSSQYFATVFKKIVGMTPGNYRLAK